MYNAPVFETPVRRLRLQSRRKIRLRHVAEFMTRHGLPRSESSICHFELARRQNPDNRFVELYARCIGQPVEKVIAAHRRTVRLRIARGMGPHVGRFGL